MHKKQQLYTVCCSMTIRKRSGTKTVHVRRLSNLKSFRKVEFFKHSRAVRLNIQSALSEEPAWLEEEKPGGIEIQDGATLCGEIVFLKKNMKKCTIQL